MQLQFKDCRKHSIMDQQSSRMSSFSSNSSAKGFDSLSSVSLAVASGHGSVFLCNPFSWWDEIISIQFNSIQKKFKYSWLIVLYAWSPVAWCRYDTCTTCHIHCLRPRSIISRPLTNWANSNWAVSQGVSGDANRHKRWNEDNINTFTRTSSCLEVLEYQMKG